MTKVIKEMLEDYDNGPAVFDGFTLQPDFHSHTSYNFFHLGPAANANWHASYENPPFGLCE